MPRSVFWKRDCSPFSCRSRLIAALSVACGVAAVDVQYCFFAQAAIISRVVIAFFASDKTRNVASRILNRVTITTRLTGGRLTFFTGLADSPSTTGGGRLPRSKRPTSSSFLLNSARRMENTFFDRCFWDVGQRQIHRETCERLWDCNRPLRTPLLKLDHSCRDR